MRAAVLAIALLFIFAIPAAAQQSLVVDLAEDHVDISTGFNGANLTLFGVREQGGEVAVVIRGPARRMVVRRKESIGGAWINRRSMSFRQVPSYYDYALSAPESELAAPDILMENGIGINALYLDPDIERESPEYVRNFQEALIRNKQAQGLFPLRPKEIKFISDNFFRASFYMPANVPVGDYKIETFLLKNGKIIEKRATDLRVAQVGFGARVYAFAHGRSLSYGLVCVFIAVLAGWMANAMYRKN